MKAIIFLQEITRASELDRQRERERKLMERLDEFILYIINSTVEEILFLNDLITNRSQKGIFDCDIFSRAAVVHLNFRVESTFPVPVCTVPSSMDRTIRCNKVDMVRLYASYRLNLL